MIASPSDLPALDVQVERQPLERAIAPLQMAGLVELQWLDGAGWRDLQRALRRAPWHIFHFVGHGDFDPHREEGLIALCHTTGHLTGRAHHFMASDLGRLLADQRTLRLAVLNACLGDQGSNRDLFSSTAATLVQRGLPAVVAMQQAITDAAAIEFTQTFYESLADGLPVDAAMSEARKAISFAVANTLEWGTPVLYSRADDGRLFTVEAAPTPRAVEPETLGSAEGSATLDPASVDPKAGDPKTVTVAGATFTFLYVPAGPFTMGAEDGDSDEKPVHTLTTDAFWLGKTPVTNAQFRPFVEGDGYRSQRYWSAAGWQWRTSQQIVQPQYWTDSAWNGAKQPVVGVSWYEALAYANWLAQGTNEPIRLATEAEWEKGARGTNGRSYPWGNEAPDQTRCNFNRTEGKTTPVDHYPKGASPYGALDMAGNVWEWTLTINRKI